MIKTRPLYLLLIVLLLGGCSQNIAIKKSKVVPAADLEVRISEDRNGNHTIDLKVENLAQPWDLTPAKNVYVVWAVSDRGSFNMGQLQLDKKLKGSLSAITPYKPNSVIISAEEDPEAVYPGPQIVLRSEDLK